MRNGPRSEWGGGKAPEAGPASVITYTTVGNVFASPATYVTGIVFGWPFAFRVVCVFSA